MAQTKDYTKEILELRMRDFSLREIAKALKISLAKVQRTLDKPEIKHALAEARKVYEETQAAQQQAKIESLHYVLAKKVIKSLSDSVEDVERKKALTMSLFDRATSDKDRMSAIHLWARLENLRLHTVKSTYDILSLEATDGTLESKLSDVSDSKDIVQVIFDS